MLFENGGADISCFDGKGVVPRFRRRHTVGESDVIPTISLAFSLADGYYPHQKYVVKEPKKEYERPESSDTEFTRQSFESKKEKWNVLCPTSTRTLSLLQ